MRSYFHTQIEPLHVSDRECAERVVTMSMAFEGIDILAQLWAAYIEREEPASWRHDDCAWAYVQPDTVYPVVAWVADTMAATHELRQAQMDGVHVGGFWHAPLPAIEDDRLRTIASTIQGLANLLCTTPTKNAWDHRLAREYIASVVGGALGRAYHHWYSRASYTSCEVSMWSTGGAARERDDADRRERVLKSWYQERFGGVVQWLDAAHRSAEAWTPPTSFYNQ